MAHLLRSRATPDPCYTRLLRQLQLRPPAGLAPGEAQVLPNALARLEVGAGVALEPGVVHGAVGRPATDLNLSTDADAQTR